MVIDEHTGQKLFSLITVKAVDDDNEDSPWEFVNDVPYDNDEEDDDDEDAATPQAPPNWYIDDDDEDQETEDDDSDFEHGDPDGNYDDDDNDEDEDEDEPRTLPDWERDDYEG